MDEASKAYERRKDDGRFKHWFQGTVLDIGCGHDPMKEKWYPEVTEVMGYDLIFGHQDAQLLPELKDNTFDTVHSSHCLEHMFDPYEALENWLRVLKPGGFAVITIPDEEMYERGHWPSMFNGDHKVSFRMDREPSKVGMPKSICVTEMLDAFFEIATTRLIHRIEDKFDPDLPDSVDQTMQGAECAIEFILQKK